MRVWPVGLLLAGAAACSPNDSPVRVSLEPGLLVPSDLLSEITTLTLQVYDTSTGVTCNAATGVTSSGGSSLPTPLDQTTLPAGSCPSGSKFCGSLTVAQSSNPLVFDATGTGSNGAVVANGCTTATINGPTETVSIKMLRYLPPAKCGDGIVEPPETCDDSTPLCQSCQTTEVELSPASDYSGGPGPVAPNERSNPFFLWPPATGKPGYFFAFYSDTSLGDAQVSMAVRSDALVTVSDFGPAVEAGPIFLPNNPTNFPPTQTADVQRNPTAAIVGDAYYVAFEDNNTPSGEFDIHLRSMDDALNAQQSGACVITNNGMGNTDMHQLSLPQMATGANNSLFMVWQDNTSQTINGCTYTPMSNGSCATPGPQTTISNGSSNAHGVVAAAGNGWVVAWQSGAGISWVTIASDGTPSGSPQSVATGAVDSPGIAGLSDGSFAIVWSDHSNPSASSIRAQRFNASGQVVDMGDPTVALDTLPGNEITPAIATTPAAGGAYVVAWIDSGSAGSGQVFARLLSETGLLTDGSGFLFNTVDGQNDEFQVSVYANRQRVMPTVAVGGSAPYIAFGWVDNSAAAGGAQPGVIGRRFPAPTQ
jgi:hypothetical protein